MRHRSSTLLLLTALGLASLPASGQELSPGDRIRVKAPTIRPTWVVGEFVAREGAGLQIRLEDSTLSSIPMDGVKKIQRLETVEVGNAEWLAWTVLVATVAAGAYFGTTSTSCEVDDVVCGIGGGLVGYAAFSYLIAPHWPTHEELRWQTVQ
jgi:hypothetical protein